MRPTAFWPRTVCLCMVLWGLAAPAWAQAQGIPQKAAKDDVVFTAKNDPAMQKAYRQARATLDDFLRKAAQPAAGTTAYAVKVGIQQDGQTEYFWIADIAPAGKASDGAAQYAGRINNAPRIVTHVRNGQPYTFSKNEIVDWTYLEEKGPITHGNFTACALLSKRPRAEKLAMQRQYGLRCD